MKPYPQDSPQPDGSDPFGDPFFGNAPKDSWDNQADHLHNWYTAGDGITRCSYPGCREQIMLEPDTDPMTVDFPESYRDVHEQPEIPPAISKAFSVMGFLIVALFALLVICFLIVGITKALEMVL